MASDVQDEIKKLERHFDGMAAGTRAAFSPVQRQRCEEEAVKAHQKLKYLWKAAGRDGTCPGPDYPRCTDPSTTRPCCVCRGKMTLEEYEARCDKALREFEAQRGRQG